MVVKPIALVAVAALVIVMAGAGGYLAVRDNRAAVGDPAVSRRDLSDPALIDVAIDSDSGSNDAADDDDAAGPSLASEAVEATEEVIGKGKGEGEDDAGPPRTDAPPVQTRTPRAPSAPAQGTGSSDANRPTSTPKGQKTERPPSAADRDHPPSPPPPTTSANDLPEAPGWERLSKPWPSRNTGGDESGQPGQVSLRSVDPETFGSTLLPEEPPLILEELVLSADSVIGLQVDTPISTDTAEVEDDVEARVTRDVMVSDRVAIPAGTRVLGSVVLVERAGQIKGASRLGVRFHTVVLDSLVEVPVVTETVYREGEGRGSKSAAKIGGAAVGGAILGAIFGGGRGAAIGGAAGAAGGTAAAMAGDGEAATLVAGATLTVRLSRPATVTVGR